jgi:hypothetical protein
MTPEYKDLAVLPNSNSWVLYGQVDIPDTHRTKYNYKPS